MLLSETTAQHSGSHHTQTTLDVQGHIGQQPLDAVPSFGGSTTAGTESSYRLWDPSKVPSPRKIVAALDKFVVGQEGSKKVHPLWAVHELSARHEMAGTPATYFGKARSSAQC